MTTLVYTVTIYERIPVETGAHTLIERGRLNGAFNIGYTDQINGPSELSVSFIPDLQDAAVMAALRSPAVEVAVWRESVRVFMGPVVTRQATLGDAGIEFTLGCKDASHYLWRRMLDVSTDTVFTQVDQAQIAVGLVDVAQAAPWAGYGIDTTQVADTGVLRDRTYPAAVFHNIGQRLGELAAVDNGFDYWIDPMDRSLQIGYPRRGQDRTATVIFDRSNIADPSATWSLGVEDMVSHADAISVSSDGSMVRGTATNDAVLAAYGRSDIGAVYQDIVEQQTIDDHAGRLAAERSGPLYLPAPQVLVSGFERGDIEPGDIVEVAYDYGLGLEVTQARIAALSVAVGDDGNETLGVELV